METRSKQDAGHALVVGAGMSGLLAARVLSGYFGEVTVLDRDALPAEPTDRSGIPQGRHLHSLATRGSQALERFFPGLDEELAAAGAPALDQARDAITVFPNGRLRRFESGVTMRAVSRSLLEWKVRERVESLPNVTFRNRREVTALTLSKGDRTPRISGVEARARGGSGETETLHADLVVDASGNASRAPRWLKAIGYAVPEEQVVDARLGYATRWYRVPADFDGDWKSLAVLPGWPHNPRGGSLRRVENDLWTVVLLGIGDVQPPSGGGSGTERDDFLEYAKRLPSGVIYEAIKGAKPVSPVYSYRRTANRRRRYERSRLPDKFLIVGDAACVLNPSYGQGMTLATLSAEALARSLNGTGLSGLSRGLSRRFQRAQARATSAAWRATTASDAQWSAGSVKELGIFGRYAHRVSNEVVGLAAEDEEVTRALLEVKNLLAHPVRLFRPGVILPAALRALRR